MPSFEPKWPSKKNRASSHDPVESDRHDNNNRNSVGLDTPHVEGENNKKAGFLKKTWKHCKRPGSVLIARTAGQPILAKSSLVLLSTSLHNPKPNTIDFAMRVTLTLPVPFTVLLEPMVIHLYRDGHAPDNRFLEVTLPACTIKSSTEIEVPGTTTNVLDMKQFGDFMNDVMFNESAMLGIGGSAKAQFCGVRSRLQLDDRIEVMGFNSFPDYAIKTCQLLHKAPDGAHLEAVLDLPNPSLVTIEMGDLTFNLYVGPVLIGEVFISDVTFTPGPNTVSSRVYIDTKAVMFNITTIIQSQKELLSSGKLGVRVSGKSTVRNGENLAYFENALSKLQLYSEVPFSRVFGSTLGEFATSVSPGHLLMLLRMTGIMAILEGNGVDVAQITQLEDPAPA